MTKLNDPWPRVSVAALRQCHSRQSLMSIAGVRPPRRSTCANGRRNMCARSRAQRTSTRRPNAARSPRSTTRGSLTFWYQGVFEGDPDLLRQYYKDFFETFRKTYPNIQLEEQALTYNDLLDKFRTALLGNAGPMAVRLQILGGVEFASKGYLQELKPEDVGCSTEDFWPGAMKSVTWEGKTYGIPTNNETMALIWNADIFKRAGLDPDKPPATWDDVVNYSKQIHDKLGVAGYGLVARKNAGNTPYRFMPQLWAYGGGVFDEAKPTRPMADPAEQPSEQEGTAGLLQHVCPRQIGPGLGAHQPAGRQPAAVPGRPARHDDLASVRL